MRGNDALFFSCDFSWDFIKAPVAANDASFDVRISFFVELRLSCASSSLEGFRRTAWSA